tara:strand:+ start:59948 stop:61597 length:1650 start_codon:yes stop_codon:yes gene_type:complete
MSLHPIESKKHNSPDQFARKRILLLCNYSSVVAETIYEHINAFAQYSKNYIVTYNIFGEIDRGIPIDKFDILVIHYSICIGRGGFLSLNAKKIIQEFKGYKILFIQDDYRWIYSTISNVQFMKIDAIFGLASQDIVPKIYNKTLSRVRVETVLTGYVSDKMLKETPIPYSQRKIDVSYRARKLPFWMGSHTLQKWLIAEKFLKSSKSYHLVCDISTKEDDRVYGENWKKLLKQSKATLGTESGTNICDFTGKLQKNIEAYIKKNPGASFETVQNIFLGDEKNNILMNVISPRIFEAISCKVLLILYPGEYNGILEPWHHYVPLKEDHSNIKEVVQIIQSPEQANKIIECAYNEVLCNPKNHYQGLIQKFDKLIEEEFKNYHRSPSQDCTIVYKPPIQMPGLHSIRTSSLLYHLIKKFSPRILVIQLYYNTKKILRDILVKLNFWPAYHVFYEDLLQQKCTGFFKYYLRPSAQGTDQTDYEIICALKSENNIFFPELNNHYIEKLFKKIPNLTVTVNYTALAESFMDSLDEIPKNYITTLNLKQIEELIK